MSPIPISKLAGLLLMLLSTFSFFAIPAHAGACSTAQKSTVSAAMKKAVEMTKRAIADLPQGVVATTPKPNYETWFGPYESNRLATVQNTLGNVQAGLEADQIALFCFGDTEMNCAGGPKVGAFVNKDDPSTMNFCSRYFDDSVTRAEDRPALIVHEFTHYTAVGGTSDPCNSTEACKALAATNPDAATKSASNYQGYAISYY